MLDAFWNWLKDPANQQTLGWVGGGVAIVAGGIWAVVKFFAKTEGDGTPPPSVKADRGGVAIKGNVTNSPIRTKSGEDNSGKARKPKS